jgi:very-short-patch-repair endonuclease
MKYTHVRKLPRNRAAGRNRADLNARRTKAERLMADALDRAGETYRQNFMVHTAESLNGYYLVDFYLPKRRLLIEVDGGVHRGEAAQWKDRLRTEAVERARPKDRLVRVWNAEVETNADACLARLLADSL